MLHEKSERTTYPGLKTPGGGESRTKQSHKDECDINILVARATKSGGVLPSAQTAASYGDFSNVGDYQDALDRIIDANEAFAALPSNIRKRFSNDPAELLEFVANADNVSEAIELGILNFTPDPAPAIPKEETTRPTGAASLPGQGETTPLTTPT